MPSSLKKHSVRSAAPVGFALLLVSGFVFATFPAWKSLIHAWSNSEDYSHGFFIVPVAIYLVWSKKETLSKIPVQGSLWGLILFLFSLFVFIITHLSGILTLRALSIIPLIAGIIIYLFGFRTLKAVAFPVTLLLLMVPIPSQIYSSLTIPLQLLVSKAAVWFASVLGVPVFREGNVIHLADRTLQVVRACSGMRSIISLLTLSAVFGYLTLRSNLLRSLLFLSGIPVAIIVNIVRVLLMLLAFHYVSIDLTKGHYHLMLGMFVFLIALGMLFSIKIVLSRWDRYPS